MPKHDYIFVDESGDPGYRVDDSSGRLLSSGYYVAAALHLCDDSFPDLNAHVAAFRYYSRMSRELKLPPEKEEFGRLLDPIRMMAEGGKNIWSSAVYLDKYRYNGRYLKPGGIRPQNPIRFRNHILRCLLEHHFQKYPLRSHHYDLVLDRVEITKEETENLQNYLAGNYNIPTPTNITHASSIYVEGLQIVHHIANGYKNVVTGSEPPDALKFVSARDVTTNQYII
ncbi:MAG: DUF3800 domain-containing protein [Chloroflexi bacterium]|nr:DUF3800 domain-containing protein [Chloroflexota bacterium]